MSTSSSSEKAEIDCVGAIAKNNYWKIITAPLYDAQVVNTHGNLSGRIDSKFLGQTLIGRSQFSTHRCVRNRELINTSGLTLILMQILLSGSFVGKFGDEDIRADVGDIVVMDYTRPFDFLVNDGETISFAFDRQMMSRFIDPRSLHGSIIRARTAAGVLITNLVTAALSIAENNFECDRYMLESDLIEIIGKQFKNNTTIKSLPADLYKQSIIDYIDININNPDISTSHLINKFNISRSHLYRMFEKDGGVNNFIWDRRLEAVQREILGQSRNKKIYLKSLAYQFGCKNSFVLNKRFKNKYLYSPLDLSECTELYENIAGNLFGIQKHLSDITYRTP
jgi:AraC-like DNA-binding protein